MPVLPVEAAVWQPHDGSRHTEVARGIVNLGDLVASCFRCNNLKADRTPQEAGLALSKQPRQITIHAKHRLLIGDEQTWDRYLFC